MKISDCSLNRCIILVDYIYFLKFKSKSNWRICCSLPHDSWWWGRVFPAIVMPTAQQERLWGSGPTDTGPDPRRAPAVFICINTQSKNACWQPTETKLHVNKFLKVYILKIIKKTRVKKRGWHYLKCSLERSDAAVTGIFIYHTPINNIWDH